MQLGTKEAIEPGKWRAMTLSPIFDEKFDSSIVIINNGLENRNGEGQDTLQEAISKDLGRPYSVHCKLQNIANFTSTSKIHLQNVKMP